MVGNINIIIVWQGLLKLKLWHLYTQCILELVFFIHNNCFKFFVCREQYLTHSMFSQLTFIVLFYLLNINIDMIICENICSWCMFVDWYLVTMKSLFIYSGNSQNFYDVVNPSFCPHVPGCFLLLDCASEISLNHLRYVPKKNAV